MKKVIIASITVLLMLLSVTPVLADDSACWGQASAVFARMGRMGEHSSEPSTPRVGLHNLAVSLYKDGTIAEPTMEALGQFVALAEGLSIDACRE